jgi:hypothetical protein
MTNAHIRKRKQRSEQGVLIATKDVAISGAVVIAIVLGRRQG